LGCGKERETKRFCAFGDVCGKESGAGKFESGDEKREKENIFFCEKENVKHCDPYLNFQSSATNHPNHYSVTLYQFKTLLTNFPLSPPTFYVPSLLLKLK